MFIDKGSFGGDHEILADSTKQDYSIESHYSAHTHVHWAFSNPGIYTFDVSYSGTTKEGQELKSESQELVVAVGDEVLETCKTSPAPNPNKPHEPGNPSQNEQKKPKPEAPKDPGNQSKPGDSSPQGFFSKFNPVHLLAPLLGGVFIARMVALFMELQPQVFNFITDRFPQLKN